MHTSGINQYQVVCLEEMARVRRYEDWEDFVVKEVLKPKQPLFLQVRIKSVKEQDGPSRRCPATLLTHILHKRLANRVENARRLQGNSRLLEGLTARVVRNGLGIPCTSPQGGIMRSAERRKWRCMEWLKRVLSELHNSSLVDTHMQPHACIVTQARVLLLTYHIPFRCPCNQAVGGQAQSCCEGGSVNVLSLTERVNVRAGWWGSERKGQLL